MDIRRQIHQGLFGGLREAANVVNWYRFVEAVEDIADALQTLADRDDDRTMEMLERVVSVYEEHDDGDVPPRVSVVVESMMEEAKQVLEEQGRR